MKNSGNNGKETGDKEELQALYYKKEPSANVARYSKLLLTVSNLFLPLRKIFIFAKWSKI